MTDYLVVDDDGRPLYFADMEKITSEGGTLAMRLAEVAGNPTDINRITSETLGRLGPETFGMVAANALSVMADALLGGAFDVAEAHGTPMREAMRRINNGEPTQEDTPTPGSPQQT